MSPKRCQTRNDRTDGSKKLIKIYQILLYFFSDWIIGLTRLFFIFKVGHAIFLQIIKLLQNILTN